MDRSPRRPNREARDERYDRDERDEMSERIEVDRLPPSIPLPMADDESTDGGEALSADAPRRRGRPRRPRPDDLPAADA